MATTSLRKCNHPSCKELTHNSRCAKHEKTKNQDTTKNRAGDPFYSSAAWLRLRNYKRMLNPLCEDCERDGRVTPMHAVDHVKTRREYPELELEIENLRSLCESHHNAKSAREQRARANVS